MSKPSWMMMEREEFFQKLDLLIAENKNTFMIAVFIPHESLIKQQLSKDDEEKLILEGWQCFLENFAFPCNCLRVSWSIYWVLLEEESEEIVSSLKKIFKMWEQGYYPDIWRIAFTNLKESKNRTLRIIGDFEAIVKNAVRYYYPSERLFQIDVDEERATPISLS